MAAKLLRPTEVLLRFWGIQGQLREVRSWAQSLQEKSLQFQQLFSAINKALRAFRAAADLSQYALKHSTLREKEFNHIHCLIQEKKYIY